jgi:hypothetical protein
MFPHQNPAYTSPLPHTCYMPRLSLSSRLDRPNNTGGGVQIIKLVPVSTAWRVLRLRMEERLPVLRVAAVILNKQSRRAETGWSSKLGVGRGASNSSP